MYLISFITNAPFMLQFISWIPSQLACSTHFKLLYFLVFFYRLKLLKGWVMGGKHLKEMLKCIVTKILQRSFRWYEIALLLLYLCFLWFCIFLTLTWNLGAVEFSAYFKVLYKLPCATLYRCFPYNCMVDFQSFLGAR